MSPLVEKYFSVMRDIASWADRPGAFSDKELDKLINACRYETLTDKEEQQYQKNKSTEQDYKEYYEAGVKEAREKGKEEGKAEGILESATKMKAIGIPVAQIMQVTGLAEAFPLLPPALLSRNCQRCRRSRSGRE